MIDNYFIGAGEVYVELEAGKLLPLFECSAAKITQSETENVLKSHMTTAGGNLKKRSRIDKVELELTIHSLHKENLGFVLRGDAEAFVAGSVTDEVVTAHKGALTRLSKVSISNVVVKNSALTVTYVAGVDYKVKGAGIFILDAGSIADGASLKVSFDYDAYNAVQALTSSQKEMKVVIDGLNAANNGASTVVDIRKVAFGFADALDFIGEDFAAITVKGECLADPDAPVGESQYFSITYVD